MAALGGAQAHRADEDRQEAVADDPAAPYAASSAARASSGSPWSASRRVSVRARKACRRSSQPTARPTRTPRTILPTTYQPSQAPRPRGRSRRPAGAGPGARREGQPVVEPGLGGEGEPDVVASCASHVPVALASSTSSVSGSPTWTSEAAPGRSGRARRRAAARPPAPVRRPTSRAPHAEDGQRHGDRQQPPHRRPAPPRPPRPQVQVRSIARPTPISDTRR